MLRNKVDPILLSYIDEFLTDPKKATLMSWWIPSDILKRAKEDMDALKPVDPDPYGYADGNAAQTAKNIELRAMSVDERKAYRWEQKMEAAMNAYRRKREQDAALGKAPVVKLKPLNR